MRAIKFVGLLALFILAGALMTQPVSAGNDLLKLSILEDILSNADSYEIVWDGPAKGKSLYFTAYKEKPSVLSDIDLTNQEFDVFSYEKVNERSYDSNRQTGYNRYWPNYQRSSYSNYYRDSSERVYIDNTLSNLAAQRVKEVEIATAGGVINTYNLARANTANTRTLAGRDVQIADTLTKGETERTRINAGRDIALREADVKAVGILADRNVELGRLTTEADVERTDILSNGETARTRLIANRDIDLARTARDETRILANRDADITRINARYDLARTDLIVNPYPRYDPYLGHYNWRY